MSLVSQDGDSAVVEIIADISVSLDEEAARDYVRALLEERGMEASDEDIDAYLPVLLEGMTSPQQVTERVDVVLRDGAWLVCDDPSQDRSQLDAAAPSPSA